jgi:hypothetical protein
MSELGVSRLFGCACVIFVVASLLLAAPASAQYSNRIQGTLDGTEPTFDSPFCGDANNYTVVGPLTPSASGPFYYRDLSISYDVDMQIDVYTGSFDPLNPLTNYFGGYDDWATLNLTAGTSYLFVVSRLCGTGSGVWDFVLAGSEDLVGSGDMTWMGTITGAEPTFASPYCGSANPYTVIGPVSPTVTGNYQFRDIGYDYGIAMQIDVYQGGFDPLSPSTNYVGGYSYWSTVALTAGVDYYIVVSPYCGTGTGAWEFVLEGDGVIAPPLVAVDVPTLGSASLAILVILMGVIGIAVLRWHTR